jgi:CheY-like chemotaxis protein/anti-sigma regulatory factor (Ser/Thr protein kinase)
VVATDEKRLRQILLNLLSNAIKFTPAGTVTLDLTYRNQIAVFTISDTGLGIRPDDLERIFEPFERGSLAAARSTPGTGLGLTIAHLLAQVMGGEITVESEVGRGTRFRVRLMLASVARPKPVLTQASAPARTYAGARRTILVADDDAAHRGLMRDILEPLGLVVLEAGDGPACLALAATRPPDLFLLDIAMPGMSGWVLAKVLREAGQTGRIAMMSANVHEISPSRGSDAPHDAIIAKPFDLRDFLECVTGLLGLHWTAGEAPAAAPPEAAAPPPRPEHLADLLRLVRIGHVRGIEAKLAEMEGGPAAPTTFIAQMRGLTAAFDLRRARAVIEGLLEPADG